MTSAAWTPDQLQRIGAARELQIASRRLDGTLRRWVPIWVVCVGERAYVRTWYRRDTGWFGQVINSHAARIRVPGLEADVAVRDVGTMRALTADIDDAYRAKYGRIGARQMVGAEAASTTLELSPAAAITGDASAD